jgi:hypothetical protein
LGGHESLRRCHGRGWRQVSTPLAPKPLGELRVVPTI